MDLGPGVGQSRQASRSATPGHPNAISFSPDGDLLATGCDDDRARVFSMPAAASKPAPLFEPVPHLASAGVAPLFAGTSGRLLTVTGRDEVTSWDARTGRKDRQAGQNRVDVQAASPDGGRVALGGWMGAQLWDARRGLEAGPAFRHRNWVRAVVFSPDGQTLVTAGADRVARLWDAESGNPAAADVPHQSEVSAAAFSHDGRSLATAQVDGLVRVWRLAAADPRDHRMPHPRGPVTGRLSGDGRSVIAARDGLWESDVPSTRVYDVASGRLAGPEIFTDGRPRDAALSPDGRVAAVLTEGGGPPEGGRPGALELWDVHSGARLGEPLPMPSVPWAVDFSPDGNRVAVICGGGQVLTVDAAVARAIRQAQHGPGPAFRYDLFAGYTPDGRYLATIGPDSTLMVWDADTLAARFPPLRIGGNGWRADLSRDGRWLTTGSTENLLHVWDLQAGQEACPPLRHPDWPFQGAFSPDGRLVLTAGRDGQARLWDWRAGQLACPPFKHDDEVMRVAFTPDGRWARDREPRRRGPRLGHFRWPARDPGMALGWIVRRSRCRGRGDVRRGVAPRRVGPLGVLPGRPCRRPRSGPR